MLNNSGTQGGGIYVHSGALRIDRSLITDNNAHEGGGLYNRGVVTLTNVTVSDNLASAVGGLYQANLPGSQMRLNNVTVADNWGALQAASTQPVAHSP